MILIKMILIRKYKLDNKIVKQINNKQINILKKNNYILYYNNLEDAINLC